MTNEQIANVILAYMVSDNTTAKSTEVLAKALMKEIGMEDYKIVSILLAPMVIAAMADIL